MSATLGTTGLSWPRAYLTAIAASIIADVRLARDQDISRLSPRLTAVVADSVALARMILAKVVSLTEESQASEIACRAE